MLDVFYPKLMSCDCWLEIPDHPSCICITETWLDGSVFDSEIHIDNYSVRRKDRNRYGGGVCLYIRSGLAFNGRDEILHGELEAVWIELTLPKTKPIVYGVGYRPPNQSNFYDLSADVCLSSADIQERESLVLSDFNANVTGSQRSKLKTPLNSFQDLLNWTQIITRISTTSSSTIYLILVSDTDKISQSRVLDVGVNDHCMFYCTRKLVKFTFN